MKIIITILALVFTANIIFAQQPPAAKEWLEIGNEQANAYKFSDAIKSYSECIRLDKTLSNCYLNRGAVNFLLKKTSEAMVDYNKAIELNPKSADAYTSRGIAYVELKNYEQAEKDFTKAVELNPNQDVASEYLSNLKKTSTTNNSDTKILDDIDPSIFAGFDELFEGMSKNPEGKCISGNCIKGKGKFKEINGNIYEGDFVNGKYQGKGKIVYANSANGDNYEGDFVTNKKEGRGTLRYRNGNYYIGEFKNDNKNGYGKEFFKIFNSVKEGTWKDGALVDPTAAVTPSPTPSTGCVSGNCVNGYGKYVFDSGSYEGNFVNGKREGQGILINTNFGVYTGQFANEVPNGKGKFNYSNGDIFEGSWINDVIQGQGTYTFKSGETYIGQYGNGKKNGKGKETLVNGGVYEGDFVNDNREGQGTFRFTDGSVYSGQFANGRRNGYGKLSTNSTITTQEGTWKDDVFINSTTVVKDNLSLNGGPESVKPKSPTPIAQCLTIKCIEESQIVTLTAQITAAPDDYKLISQRGKLYVKSVQPSNALADAEKLLQINPNSSVAFTIRGAVHRLNGNNSAALVELEKALTIDPNESGAILNRGILRFAEGNKDGGFADLNRAIQLSDNLISWQRIGLVYALRGAQYAAAGDYPRAVADYKQASSLGFTGDDDLRIELVLIYDKMGDKAKADETHELVVLSCLKNKIDCLKSPRYYAIADRSPGIIERTAVTFRSYLGEPAKSTIESQPTTGVTPSYDYSETARKEREADAAYQSTINEYNRAMMSYDDAIEKLTRNKGATDLMPGTIARLKREPVAAKKALEDLMTKHGAYLAAGRVAQVRRLIVKVDDILR